MELEYSNQLEFSRVFNVYRGTLFNVFFLFLVTYLLYNLLTLLGKIKVWLC